MRDFSCILITFFRPCHIVESRRLYSSSGAAFSLSSSSIQDPFPSPNLSRACSSFAPSPFRNQLTHYLLGLRRVLDQLRGRPKRA